MSRKKAKRFDKWWSKPSIMKKYLLTNEKNSLIIKQNVLIRIKNEMPLLQSVNQQ